MKNYKIEVENISTHQFFCIRTILVPIKTGINFNILNYITNFEADYFKIRNSNMIEIEKKFNYIHKTKNYTDVKYKLNHPIFYEINGIVENIDESQIKVKIDFLSTVYSRPPYIKNEFWFLLNSFFYNVKSKEFCNELTSFYNNRDEIESSDFTIEYLLNKNEDYFISTEFENNISNSLKINILK